VDKVDTADIYIRNFFLSFHILQILKPPTLESIDELMTPDILSTTNSAGGITAKPVLPRDINQAEM